MQSYNKDKKSVNNETKHEQEPKHEQFITSFGLSAELIM